MLKRLFLPSRLPGRGCTSEGSHQEAIVSCWEASGVRRGPGAKPVSLGFVRRDGRRPGKQLHTWDWLVWGAFIGLWGGGLVAWVWFWDCWGGKILSPGV